MLREIARLFLKLGFLGFGGPAAHIAMMDDEVVERRAWLTRQHFLDLVGATNLIPGPNSTEMAIHVGYQRGGFPGLIIAGVCFVGPAIAITTCLAWAYVRFGSLPDVAPFLAGIKPAVLAVILVAVGRLGKKATKSIPLAAIGLAAAALVLAGVSEIFALFACGIAGMFLLRGIRSGSATAAVVLLFGAAGVASAAATRSDVSLTKLALFFLKVGAVLYGSGYVLIAFLEGGLVHDYGWITNAQLLDAIAVGQFTPGPLLSTASFIGYVVAGFPGAIAGAAIMVPSFIFVAIVNPIVPRLRRSAWMSAFLDAVNVSAVGLMAGVAVGIGRATLTDWTAWVILLGALAASLRFKVGAPRLVIGGAILGRLLGIISI